MFLDLNDTYKYLNYIINSTDLTKAIKEELIYFNKRDYQYCYYLYYVLNLKSYFFLNRR